MEINKNRKIYPILPLRDVVVFPAMVVPLLVGRARSIRAVEEAMNSDRVIFLSAQKNLKIDEPKIEDIYEIGTISEILQILKLPDGSVRILAEGKSRARIKKIAEGKDFYNAETQLLDDTEIKEDVESHALMRAVLGQFEEYVKLNPRIPPEVVNSVNDVKDIAKLADLLTSHITVKVEEKQKILEELNPASRLQKLAVILNNENEILLIEKKIMGDVKQQMEKSQKEYFLQEQLKAIEKELGEKGSSFSEAQELKVKIKQAHMTKDAEASALKEAEKLSHMLPSFPESTVSRNYIEWLISLPWVYQTKDNLNIKNGEEILNRDHYGLDKPKERILEYLAVRRLSDKIKGQILCFVGPPGVGKTSLAKSIARALGRNFVRVSLGGIRDEAEIRGHRRTYIGSMPGRIIQSLKKSKSKNPVFLLDEVDKMSVDFHGDPASALLEVLDPEQNSTFSDHYLEVEFDLSNVMFITTANLEENIPYPLLDRMELIKLPGYTEYEKMHIASDFLIPKVLIYHGLTADNIKFTEQGIIKIIRSYTREAGVRMLEKKIAAICRKVARIIVSEDNKTKIEITAENLDKFLGVEEFSETEKDMKEEAGVATGLAWTETGGDIIAVESTVMPGTGKLTLTGKLGDVMKESAQAAISFIRSRAQKLKLKNGFHKNMDIHIHIPEGAIPKDGPSAGITMACSLISCLTKKPIKKSIAMTGEITLRGRVLPVGGLKSKLLAAHRARLKTIIIPKANKKDLAEIPDNIKKQLDIKFVENMDEVLDIALSKNK